jgi:hypothetical protein
VQLNLCQDAFSLFKTLTYSPLSRFSFFFSFFFFGFLTWMIPNVCMYACLYVSWGKKKKKKQYSTRFLHSVTSLEWDIPKVTKKKIVKNDNFESVWTSCKMEFLKLM